MVWFFCTASTQQSDLRLSGPPPGQGGARGRARTHDNKILQVSKWICYPLCHQRPPVEEIKEKQSHFEKQKQEPDVSDTKVSLFIIAPVLH
ncbi:hypothetical protein PoB_006828600 [Plakobranchus ocellatus]|uniref:Uncharacterized protein n=1 Tax=Plakobranchus ocellatus TaxID=259542 RepID=A0AAV4DCI6_9GAST|nr:hypothetical protein PoB_006828600 [Plakobranchus ocellatus]